MWGVRFRIYQLGLIGSAIKETTLDQPTSKVCCDGRNRAVDSGREGVRKERRGMGATGGLGKRERGQEGGEGGSHGRQAGKDNVLKREVPGACLEWWAVDRNARMNLRIRKPRSRSCREHQKAGTS